MTAQPDPVTHALRGHLQGRAAYPSGFIADYNREGSERGVQIHDYRPDTDECIKFHLACLDCDWRCGPEFRHRCPECSGALESRLDLREAAPRDADSPELAYFDFLPVVSPSFLDEGISVRTPCRPAPALGAEIGLPHLWLKDESQQPTRTTKDRLASVVLAVFRQFGITEWAASSTGNSSTALARAAHRDRSMRAHFFCGKDFIADHRFETNDRISLNVVSGSYADASREAQTFAAERGIAWEGGFFNWARREGLKIAYLEAFDAMGQHPDVVVQAISSGMGMMAARKGAEEYLAAGKMTSMPRFLMVQQDTCAPMARAWRDGREELTDNDVIARPEGLARAILLGDGRATFPYMRDIARATGGSIVSVSQGDMTEARKLLRELEGIEVCHSAAATVAALRNEAETRRIVADQVVLANLTGRSEI